MAKLIDKIANTFGFQRMVEASNWRPDERAYVWTQAQDSKVDISNGDRTRLVGLSRKLFYNNAIVRSAIRDKATYSIGSGITPQANSGDPAWDDAAEAWWDEWSKSPEISGRHDMRRLQTLVSEAIDRDGEIFCILTNKRDGLPAVQVVESHRVANPPDKADEIVDGVSLDRYARPLAYHVVEGDTFSQRTSRRIQADLMLHVYEPERPDQVRGYPAVAVALNNLLDRDELLRFEMQAAKIGSSIGLVVQNATGATGAEGFFGDLSKATGENLTRETVFGGGMIPRLKATERIESFAMQRPNEKLDAHLEQYIRAAALGLGLPYEFIWDTSAVGGVAQRFIIQKAARAFAARQDVLIASFLGKLWNYAIANAVRSGQLPMTPNWRRVHWQTPRSITVDVGREAQARRDDVKAGLMTLADFFGEQGLDWKTAMQEIAAERQFASDLGIVVGVERTEGATVIDPALPAGDGGSTPPASIDAELESEQDAIEFSDRARKKKRIYKRKKVTSELAEGYKPTKEMAEAAERALEWRREYGRGMTPTGVARARDISNRANLSAETVKRMVSFFARHGVNRSEHYDGKESDGGPTAWRIAWDGWGGDAGRSWANDKAES